ncbi:OmpA/MotB family protein [Halothermothrix orenii]|uniref:OmpA/MotB domain protein n=1 Tax=Halothermothrix orenii (strain H 168 / OCM 544 / DSM 9562) TaxID=373903 RepID=B8CYQ8_HALOH|nr:OmpA family protein [Halothermothrix orenii]ACL70427.1 OmpA/MotB domain protein [Halothermothrix orenii H 168]
MPKLKKDLEEENKNTSPGWMVTYGDMMTLLLVFFVFLYSFSVMNVEKFEGFISALQAKLGVMPGGKTIMDEELLSRGSIGNRFNPSNQVFEKVMGQINRYVEKEKLSDRVKMELTKRGLVVRLTGQVLYDIGKAEIKPGGKRLLDEIAGIIEKIPNEIAVEGHTDNWPIHNEQFPSNWELSTTRATNVIKYFIERHGIDPSRLSAAGYSEYRPLYPNDTVEHRAKNRRVEIVILNTLHNKAMERR